MRIFLMIAVLLASNLGFAEMYKWKDENGKTQYSDQPPPKSVQATQLRSQGGTKATSANTLATPTTSNKTPSEKEADLRKSEQSKKDKEAQLAAEKAQAEINQKNCNIAQQNLRNLKSGSRIGEVNEKGERVILDNQQKNDRIAEAENDVAKYCKE